MLTIAYIRVSTEDQVDYSPDAQRNRCLQHAISHDLGSVTFLSDEGLSGKDLNRPRMAELIELVEAGQVANVIVWRLDRLSRDSGDLNRLIKLFEKHCVDVHSVSEGKVDVASASGRMQAGIHGVLAQYYREGLVENVKMGNHQAIAQRGRWLNRAPTGYSMVNGFLEPNEMAPLIPRVFALRAAGKSYTEIEAATGIKYSTVRQICHNRAYLGETRLKKQWYPGIHQPLVSNDQFDAAQRGNSTGKRIGKDILSGRVKCSLCGRRLSIDTNGRGEPIYRCKHRGKGCDVPGRSSKGLQRAVKLAMRVLAEDESLQEAIRQELGLRATGTRPALPARAGAVAQLRKKRQKLLDLYYADKITAELFAEQEQALSQQIRTIESEAEAKVEDARRRTALADQFEEVAQLLRSMDTDAIWNAASEHERKVLVGEIVEAVVVHPDHLRVTIHGAPPILVTLAEVGLREVQRPPLEAAGTGIVVSKGGLEPPRT
ncbi:MAG: recombinase family protein [Actinobacteria bacterium]|nr:recombinase family protein [Actinomycetota bacterium]